jgi:hypothetical protein
MTSLDNHARMHVVSNIVDTQRLCIAYGQRHDLSHTKAVGAYTLAKLNDEKAATKHQRSKVDIAPCHSLITMHV